MRKLVMLAVCLIGTLGLAQATTAHDAGPHAEENESPQAPSELKLENLLKRDLDGAEGTEVIVSRVSIPPNTVLPKHWHPGEEFAYVVEGAVTLWQEGEEDLPGKAGDAMVVPLKKVHTAMTGEEGATLIVFRVHKQGQPERVLVD